MVTFASRPLAGDGKRHPLIFWITQDSMLLFFSGPEAILMSFTVPSGPMVNATVLLPLGPMTVYQRMVR